MTALLDVSDVTLRYKTSSAVVTATERVSFTVDRSDRFVLLGPSGCGKSTLLKAVGGYMTPSEGKMRIIGPRDHRARRRPDDDLPGIRPAAAVEDGAGKRHVSAADDAAAAAQGSRGAGAGLYREGQPHPRRRRLSAHAVRRHEAARRDRARHGDGAGYPADGRAVRGAGRADAAHLPGRIAAALGRNQIHRAVRHPFDRRSDQDRQPHPAAVAASRPGQGRGRRCRPGLQRGRQRRPARDSRSTICCSPIPQRHIEGARDGRSQNPAARCRGRDRRAGRGRAQADRAGAAVERRLRPQGRDHRVPRRGLGGLRHLARQSAAVPDLPRHHHHHVRQGAATAPFRCAPGRR